MVAATKEDDNEEYYSKADGLIANPINLKTRQRFCDVQSVASNNSEIENSFHKHQTNLAFHMYLLHINE